MELVNGEIGIPYNNKLMKQERDWARVTPQAIAELP